MMHWTSICSVMLLAACSAPEPLQDRPPELPSDPSSIPPNGPLEADDPPDAIVTKPEKPGPPYQACDGKTVDWSLEPAWEIERWSWEFAIGRILDSNLDKVVDDDDDLFFVSSNVAVGGRHTTEVFRYQASGVSEIVSGAWRSYARIGDLDGRPGAEVAVAWYVLGEKGDRATIFGEHVVDEFRLPEDSTATPWLADIDGDGNGDFLGYGHAIDVSDGSEVLDWDVVGGVQGDRVAVDLDLDGLVEVLATEPSGNMIGAGLLHTPGGVSNPCMVSNSEYYFAVGQLDADDEGEFVVAGTNGIAVCDTDGSRLFFAELELDAPRMVGLADLDGDFDAEIIVTGENWDRTYPFLVLDHELNFLWEHTGSPWYAPFTVADLDANGDHEILVLEDGVFRILDGDGSELTHWTLPEGVYSTSDHGQPVVVDLDHDGLAEIALPLSASVVLDTPDGGFPAPGATEGWTGFNHFPGLMATDGTLDTLGAHWLTLGGNAWQGHRTCVVPIIP